MAILGPTREMGSWKKNVAMDWTKSRWVCELELKGGESVILEFILDFADITEIPMSIDFLRKLDKLSANCCESLEEIPKSIWDLQNLQYLDISGSGIEKLPSAIGRLKSLRTISLLSYCSLKEQFQGKSVTRLCSRLSISLGHLCLTCQKAFRMLLLSNTLAYWTVTSSERW
ncbi:hypothetical protein BT93_B1456 [Corymbia citriodora subsp. variegata]|nr:hypothetical protein BT93_B1456 [Corymbia citriodora subsp. variegata]